MAVGLALLALPGAVATEVGIAPDDPPAAPTDDPVGLSGTAACAGEISKDSCLFVWDHGQDAGFGDDAVWVGVLVHVAARDLPALAALPAPDAALSPPLDAPLAAAGLGGACGAVDACGAPRLLVADTSPDAWASALRGTLRPAATSTVPWSEPEGKDVPDQQVPGTSLCEWLCDLMPSLHLEAGVVQDAPSSAAPAAAASALGAAALLAPSETHAFTLDAADAQASPSPVDPARHMPAPEVGSTMHVTPPAPSEALAFVTTPGGTPGNLLGAAAAMGVSLALAWGLYTRIAAHRALDQPTRRRIYEAVAAAPGVRIGTLHRDLGLSYPAVERHVRLLLDFGLLEAHGDGQRRLFVRGSASPQQRAAVVAAATPQAQQVLAFLHAHGPSSLGELRAGLGIPRSTASLVVKRLAEGGLVVTQGIGGRLVVRLPEAAVPVVVAAPEPASLALARAPMAAFHK